VNMKYYLVLLISVFLSLGLGIVVGISLEGKDVLEKQHNTIAQQLEEEFMGIRNENRHLKDTVTSLQKLEKENKELNELMFNAMIKNKLNGLGVALIEAGDERDFSSLISILKTSGASIESSITFETRLFDQDEAINEAVKASAQIGMDKEQLYNELAINLMDSILEGRYTHLVKNLNQLNLIHSSINVQNSCDAIILVLNSSNNSMEAIAKFSKDFMELCWENSIPVVVVEDQEGNLMNIDQFRRMGISTIDHIDTLYGKLSLVSLLYGNSGNFGYGDGAQGILPEELFPERQDTILDLNEETRLESDREDIIMEE